MNNSCPVCKSYDIVGGHVETDDGFCWQPVECEDCQSEWQEVYVFAHVDNIKDNTTKKAGEINSV